MQKATLIISAWLWGQSIPKCCWPRRKAIDISDPEWQRNACEWLFCCSAGKRSGIYSIAASHSACVDATIAVNCEGTNTDDPSIAAGSTFHHWFNAALGGIVFFFLVIQFIKNLFSLLALFTQSWGCHRKASMTCLIINHYEPVPYCDWQGGNRSCHLIPLTDDERILLLKEYPIKIRETSSHVALPDPILCTRKDRRCTTYSAAGSWSVRPPYVSQQSPLFSRLLLPALLFLHFQKTWMFENDTSTAPMELQLESVVAL